MDTNKSSSTQQEQQEVASSRREFLKKAGRFAVYTPPALMLLSRPSRATILKSAEGRPNCDPREQIKPWSRIDPVEKKPVQLSGYQQFLAFLRSRFGW